MDPKNKTNIVEGKDASAGAATLHPGTRNFDDPKAWSKTEALSKMLGHFASMDKTTLAKWTDEVLAQVGKEGEGVSDSDHAKNTASITMHPSAAVKEDVEALFADQELSEEFKEKTVTLFEAAVNLKVKEAVIAAEEKLQIEFDEKLVSEIENYNEQLTTKLDAYLDRQVDQWMVDNEVAIVSQLKSNISEGFINDLKDLFIEHYIDIPDDKVDVVESLSSDIAELKEDLDASILEVNALKAEVELSKKDKAFEKLSEGLTIPQKEKLATLCESIAPEVSLESFIKKIEVIKEHELSITKEGTVLNETTVSVKIDEDENELNTENKASLDPAMANLVESFNLTVPKK